MYKTHQENVLRKFKNKISWVVTSQDQKLSEDFIREFADKVN